MLHMLEAGGPILWIILALLIPTGAIIIERLMYFRKIRVDESKLFLRVKAAIQKSHFDEALSICDNNISPLSSLIKAGIENRHYSPPEQKELLKEAANQEVPQLEKNLTVLSTISNIGPLLGLLGTVTGIINSFGVLGQFGQVADPSLLAKGISEALLTTAAGIILAVPAVIFYNYLVNKTNLILIKMENQVNELILMINVKKDTGLSSRAVGE